MRRPGTHRNAEAEEGQEAGELRQMVPTLGFALPSSLRTRAILLTSLVGEMRDEGAIPRKRVVWINADRHVA